jgi:hypothetical protein
VDPAVELRVSDFETVRSNRIHIELVSEADAKRFDAALARIEAAFEYNYDEAEMVPGLLAEVERLRAALERIAWGPIGDDGPVIIARAALAGGER